MREGRFHVWSVETIDQGLEILTGQGASKVHDAVNARLEELAADAFFGLGLAIIAGAGEDRDPADSAAAVAEFEHRHRTKHSLACRLPGCEEG